MRRSLQEPDLIKSFTEENENIAARWIKAQFILNQTSQTVYSADAAIAHVSLAPVQEVPATSR